MSEYDGEPRYPIGTVAERTGLTTHVIRAWERRYAAVEPVRSEGGTRLYSSADIYRLRLLRRLSDAGGGLARLAALPTSELQRLAQEESVARAGGEAWPARSSGEAPGADRFIAESVEALGRMDAQGLHGVLMRAVVALPFQAFAERLLVPLLHRTGELWAAGDICPAHEHVLSAQVVRVLGWLSDAIRVPASAPDAVAVTPSGERHELGALLAGTVAAEEGWRVTYLGADLPAADVAAAVRARGARVVLLSVVRETEDEVEEAAGAGSAVGSAAGSGAGRGSGLGAYLRALRAALGDAPVPVLVGGRGAAERRDAVEAAGGTWVRDLAALRGLLRDVAPVGGEP